MNNEISNILNLIKTGNTDKALQDAKVYYKKNTNSLEAIKLLAYSYIQVGNFESVIYYLKQGFDDKKEKQDFDYFNNMGYALSQIEEYEESIFFLEKAAKLKSNNPSVFTTLAEVYLKKREFNKAKELILTSFKIIEEIGSKSFNKHANIFLLISEINTALKKDEETKNLFSQILKSKFNENLFFLLINIDPKTLSKDLIIEAENNLILNNKNYQNKIERFNHVIPLYFGLAMYYQSKDKKKSEKYFDDANKEIFNSTRYNSHQYQEKILRTMDLYLCKYKDFDESKREHGKNNFFILGSPRSGTTLVESIITANNNVFSGGELKSCKDIIEKNILSKNQSFNDLNHKFLSKYLRRTSYLRGSYATIVDKMPENFLYLGLIQKLLPKSKVIRIFRSPWDIAISLYKQRYILNVPYSVSFFNIGVFLANFEAINVFWNENIKEKKNILNIKYEDLVSDSTFYQKKIYEFLEIDPKKYDKLKRNNFFSPTASIRQVKEGIHQKSVKKEDFMHQKTEFIEAFSMQQEYWSTKKITLKRNYFFDYPI